MSKDFEVDEKELAKQMKDAMLKEDYIKLEIIASKSTSNPIVDCDVNKVGPREVALVYVTLDELKRVLERDYPTAIEYANEYLEIRGSTKLNLDD